MLVCFTLMAKPGKEKEFEAALNDPEMARTVARFLGATRNTLFVANGRMVRILDFPDGHKAPPLSELAKKDAHFAAFMQRLGAVVQDGEDMLKADSLAAFNARYGLPLAFDVRP